MESTQKMVGWLYDLQHFGVKLGLDNIRSLLDLLDHPESSYRSLLVGGTNGKGSVAAMVESILGAAGVRAGMFTSPHLVRPNERIRLAGQDIDSPELERQLGYQRQVIEAAVDGGRLETHPSFFEVITACALQSFKDHDLQAAVLEVGLGGRLDATNAVDADVSVIVSIDLDHTKTLGGSLEEIAFEKAGIVKPGKPLISGVVQQRAISVLQRICKERDAELIDGRARVRLVADADDQVTFESEHGRYESIRLGLAGRHQVDNARIAVAAYEVLAERLGLAPDVEAVRRGLAEVRWAGRLAWLDPVDGSARLLVDGAHNAAGVLALESHLRSHALSPSVLLFGATSGKPLKDLMAPLAQHVRHAVITRPPVNKGLDPEEVADVARPLFDEVEIISDNVEALERAREIAGRDGFVLVTGSLYLIGEILGLLEGVRAPGPVAL